MKRLPTTPRSRVRSALRQVWLRSRERAARLKQDRYTCQVCNRKQSRAKGREFKVQVHHLRGLNWEHLIDLVFEYLLVHPEGLVTLCEECHEGEHVPENFPKEKG
jgi:5-methylcytosine-specific restriction endonuclease McrA